MEITCIMCPVGCTLKVENDNGKITVSGNSCPRGAIYGEREITNPARVITTIKKYKNKTISLKSDAPISKDLILKVLKRIRDIDEPAQIKAGDVLIHNIYNSGVNIVVTKVNS